MRASTALFALAVVALAASPALAAGKGGVTMPDTKTVEGKSLTLNGLGIREATVFNVDVYVAGLYLESKSNDAARIVESEQVKHLVLHFVRDVDKADITGAWKEGFEKNAGAGASALKAEIDRLNGWMANMKEGQQLVFTYVPDKGVTVEVDGKAKGTIGGAEFGRALFSIWLGKKPPNSSLKAGLLGR